MSNKATQNPAPARIALTPPGVLSRIEEINASLSELRAAIFHLHDRLGVSGSGPLPSDIPAGLLPQVFLALDQIQVCKTAIEELHEFF